jgi:nitroreductase
LKFEDVVEKRRSIRKYKDTPVPKEKIFKILEAARIAPSAGHRQPWHFIVVENKETITKLAKNEWAAQVPVMIVGLADHARACTVKTSSLIIGVKQRLPLEIQHTYN